MKRASSTITMHILTLAVCCVLNMKRGTNCFSLSVAVTGLNNTSMPAAAFSTEWKDYESSIMDCFSKVLLELTKSLNRDSASPDFVVLCNNFMTAFQRKIGSNQFKKRNSS